MKKFTRFLSYLIVFLLGVSGALTAVTFWGMPLTKLEQLEHLISARFIGETDAVRMEDAAAEAMVASLGDRWSYYVPARDYETLLEQQENAYVGIGVTIPAEQEHDGFRIISLHANGSAAAAGLQLDDIILTADGQSAAGMTVEDLRNVIRGREGTTVRLTVLRGEAELEFEVKRMKILTEVVRSEMPEEGIGLISILNFDSRCAEEAVAAIEALQAQGASALILDVRNNPGGYADELVKLLDYLLPEGEVFHTVDYSGRESIDYSDADFLDLPIAVLCNGNSYSAAEFFAAAIQEYGRGSIVGTPTCGKGYFQYTYQLMDGSAVGLSVGKYFTPKGNSLIGVGVQPDILVELDEETAARIAYGRMEPLEDPQILAAMEALR